tara:strand:+ start:1941 stop:2657 length:717 start_codon:yes stop_codon:yes gene_type:complete
MTITKEQLHEQLTNALYNADKLNNFRDRDVLHDMARSLKKWGALTSGQAQYAQALIERNSNEKASKIDEVVENHRIKWQDDGSYREWVLFLAKFFLSSRQTAYMGHINNRRPNARNVLLASADADLKPPTHFDCNRLTSSKLAPRLRDTFEKPLLYSVGDLVQVRASELGYAEKRNGLDQAMGFITEVNVSDVHEVATYNKTKGGTRTYKIMFPSGETIRQERAIKLVSRKNRGKQCK